MVIYSFHDKYNDFTGKTKYYKFYVILYIYIYIYICARACVYKLYVCVCVCVCVFSFHKGEQKETLRSKNIQTAV